MTYKQLVLFAIWFTIIACKKNNNQGSTANAPVFNFESLSKDDTGIDFINDVRNQKDFNVLSYRNYYNGGGVAIGDINNDGLNDIYFTANLTENKLYLNKGNMNFEDISKKAGVIGKKAWCTGVTMADVNQDGWQDIYVCYSGEVAGISKENELFINQKNGTFKEMAKDYGLNDNGLSTQASFFDYDLDGDLDCYVLNNSYKDPERIALFKRERVELGAEGGDRLYRNDSSLDAAGAFQPKFTDITASSGIFSSNIGFGLGISVGDVNNDFWPDIYISNDFWERDYLYINNKNGTFSEQLTDRVSYTSVSSMGSDIADINNDGSMDIFSTDMLPPDNYRIKAATKFDDFYFEDIKFKNSYFHQFVQNCLHVNNGQGAFQETAHMSGVAATDWSWGALIFDMNLDGQKDIFVSNGVYQDITNSDFADFIADKDKVKAIVEEKGRYDFRDFEKYLPNNQRKNYAFINNGNLLFENKATQMGLDEPSYSNGAAYGDLDNDGDYDLVVNNVNMDAFVYKNTAVEAGKKSLKLKFEGSSQNKKGIGTLVKLYQNNKVQISHVMAARGFQSNVDTDIIFGIDSAKPVDSLLVIWPDRKYQVIKNIAAKKDLVLKYAEAQGTFVENSNTDSPILTDISALALPNNAVHVENMYNDFDNDRLMPHMLSNEGPKIVKGDINGDKQEDFVLLGAKGQSSKVYLQKNDKFEYSIQAALERETIADATAGALFDADRDGDNDLLIAYGGNEYKLGNEAFRVKYFVNDGKGTFNREIIKAPNALGQINCVLPGDYDKDGDIDLFLGGHAIPGLYGVTPRSYVLQNEGMGNFQDATSNNTGPIGMVKDAVWSDLNNDTWPDLVVVGEWMPVSVLLNDGGELGPPKPLEHSNGWWNTIKAADLDGDGDTDFIAGNWGLNMKLKASIEKPLSLYVKDFDQDKRPDAIMEWYTPEDQIPYPFASKIDISTKMPFLKKQILKYEDYAKKQVKDLFPDTDKAEKKMVYNFATSIIKNNGDKGFSLEPFNVEAQLSPVFGIEIYDLDGDNLKDIYMGGNYYKLKPEIGRHDGFNGGFFKNLGKGQYRYISPQKSGIVTSGQVRDAKVINEKLIIAINNAPVKVFKASTKK